MTYYFVKCVRLEMETPNFILTSQPLSVGGG